MIQPSLRQWLGTSVLGGLLLAGCNHAQRQPATYSATPAVSAVTTWPAPTPALPAPVPPAPDPVVVTTAPPASNPEPAEPATPLPQQVVTVIPEQNTLPAAYTAPKTEVTEAPVHRRSFADITARSCFDHASDYSWLQGELELIHPDMIWQLRYCSVEDEDRYGGSVTLIDTGSMKEYRSGQCVRVTGELVHPGSHEVAPAFRVRTMELLPGD